MPVEEIQEVHVLSLTGLGASYQMSGYFTLLSEGKNAKIDFKGVAFGGHYGGHNVNIEISPEARQEIMSFKRFQSEESIEQILSEVQRRLLNGEMIVEFDKLKPEKPEGDVFGGFTP